MVVVVYVDGLCEPRNPGGTATYGFVVYINGEKKHEGCGIVGEGEGMSNNVSEYSGLIAALEWLYKNGYAADEIIVRSDSQLLVNQMSGLWACRGGMYKPYYEKAKAMLRFFKNIKFEWIPREKNEEADRLSRRAYKWRLILGGDT
jgi:ribonuclease HI